VSEDFFINTTTPFLKEHSDYQLAKKNSLRLLLFFEVVILA